MSKYTAEQVGRAAAWTELNIPGEHYLMLQELARRLRQEEEENKRDPVTDPMPGDRLLYPNGLVVYWNGRTPHEANATVSDLQSWSKYCSKQGATIIRRREVPQ